MVREFGESKRNSVGRALPDTALRIVDPDTGAELPAGEQGLLEAKMHPISDDWIRTTDIASIDADGFVTLHGRADGAINRGGFKILPETVRRVLISHPAVRDACVVGVPDARLGQVPFAADRDRTRASRCRPTTSSRTWCANRCRCTTCPSRSPSSTNSRAIRR